MLKEKKDKFAPLPVEFRDDIAAMSESEIKSQIAKVALDTEALRQAQEEDQDLTEKKEAVKFANAPYRDGFKQNRLKIEFMRQVLGDKGKPTGDAFQDEEVVVSSVG